MPEIVPGDDQLPPDPVALARSLSASEAEVAGWVEHWAATTTGKGIHTNPPLQVTRLSTVALVSLGRAVAFVDGGPAAIPWYLAAVEVIPAEPFADPDPAMLAALRSISRPLYDEKHYSACEQVYSKIVDVYPGDDDEARKVAFLHAETLYCSGRAQEAFSKLEGLAVIDESKGDVSASDRKEAKWVRGLILYALGRYSEAIPQFQEASRGANSLESDQMIIFSLVASDQSDQARPIYKRWCRSGGLATTPPMTVNQLADIFGEGR